MRRRDREQPVRAGADDEQRVAGPQPGAVERAQHAAQRLDERAGDRVELAERQQLADERRAEAHALGEAAGVQRGRAKLLAERLVAAPAAPALAARRVVVDDDAVADRDRVDARRPPTAPRRRPRGRARPAACATTYVSLTSEPQTPQASTRQTTSPGPATGSGSSSMTTSRGVSDRATLIASSPRAERRRQQREHRRARRRRGDAALGDERGDELGGRDVEGRVAHGVSAA